MVLHRFVLHHTFDVQRTLSEHLAFSKGEDHCGDADLARLEFRLMLQALLKLTKQIELTGKVQRLRPNFVGVRGLSGCEPF
jgi:cytochrome P450